MHNLYTYIIYIYVCVSPYQFHIPFPGLEAAGGRGSLLAADGLSATDLSNLWQRWAASLLPHHPCHFPWAPWCKKPALDLVGWMYSDKE